MQGFCLGSRAFNLSGSVQVSGLGISVEGLGFYGAKLQTLATPSFAVGAVWSRVSVSHQDMAFIMNLHAPKPKTLKYKDPHRTDRAGMFEVSGPSKQSSQHGSPGFRV